MTNVVGAPNESERAAALVPILRVERFTKHFAEVKANTDVSLDVLPGEVHALVGENGAGKSTLLKMIYGVYTPDSGRMLIDDTEVSLGSPAEARNLGIGMVFQDLRLVPALTVTENMALSLDVGAILRPRALAKRIAAASEEYGLAVEPRALVQHLSIGERQRAEILKVLMTGARLVILDEPTSVLAPQEVQALFGVVERLRSQGFGILIVTHKLNEVRAIADRVTVLRGGVPILEGVQPGEYSDEQLITAMVGHAVPALPAERSAVESDAEHALALEGVSSRGDKGHEALKSISLTVRRGELVGVAGVAGSGQRELCEVATGLRDVTSGTVRIAGLAAATPRKAIDAGAVSVPEDPVADSVVTRLTVLEHMPLDGRPIPRKRWGIDWARIKSKTADSNDRLGLRIAPIGRKLFELSGGNIQRVILTRELSADSTLVVAAYPSRGLDISNVRRTQQVLLDRRAGGAGVLMISEDLDELMAMADRIVVLHDGHLSGEVLPADYDRQHIGRLMLGGVA
ncbi:MAG: ATP-binding cassette domain-containing protein [Microbacterium sp.]